VPSETSRHNDLKGSILDLKANFAFLTPTVASTLDDEALQAFDSLEIGGEAADEKEMRRIQQHTRVRFIYGPSECTPITTLAEPGAHALSIGKPSGVLAWLVDPQVPNRLVGVGCVAELWLEGPLAGSGYYKDEERTTAAFVANPPYMIRARQGHPGRAGRAYRTGDLVRYSGDGSMQFVGRSNTQQVKIRGQRVELLDIQHNVQDALRRRQPNAQVIADVGEDGVLAAFVCSPSQSWTAASLDARISLLRVTATNIKDELAGMVSKYMIPALFVPVEAFPTGQTGKLDRRKLRSMLAELSQEQRELCHLDPDRADSALSRPETPFEKQLQSLWAAALNIDVDTIKTEDNFFHRGGDSLTAMKLVNLARKENLSLCVKEVWDQPRLHDLADHLSRAQSPWSEISWSEISKSTASLDEVPPTVKTSTVSEVLPVTCSQHQFLNGTLNGHGAHVYHLLVDLPATTTANCVRKACEQWIQHFDILRARFVCTTQRVSQIIDADVDLPWHCVQHDEGDIEDTIKRTCDLDRAKLGQSPDPRSCMTRLYFVESQSGPKKLIIRLGHAQYDGASLPRMLSTLMDFMEDRAVPIPRPFADYVRHITSRNPDSYRYWRNLLQGTHSPTVVQPTHMQNTGEEQLLMASKIIGIPTLGNAAQTPAIKFVAACAAMLARITYNNDVVFGCIVSGRSSVPLELRDVCGPCLNEIPIRVTFPDGHSSPITVLDQVRGQLLESSAHETVGFDEIAAHCTSWSPDVEDFDFTVHYQNSGDSQQLKGERGTVVPCRLVESGHLPIPKANYIEVEAIPMADDQLMINIMGKSSRYKQKFLEETLAGVCSNMGV
jgi:aryl carrier-like protein